jgi:hypothetical protein
MPAVAQPDGQMRPGEKYTNAELVVVVDVWVMALLYSEAM